MDEKRVTYSGVERRSNPRLRELIDEMLASIRASHKVELWSDEERAKYQEELSRIMDSVRSEAIARSRNPSRARLS